MAKELNEQTSFNLSVETIGGVAVLIAIMVGMWYTLQADINRAKELPENKWNPEWEEKLPDPDVSRMEFDMKDELIRQTIMTTQDDVIEIKENLKRLENKIDQLR